MNASLIAKHPRSWRHRGKKSADVLKNRIDDMTRQKLIVRTIFYFSQLQDLVTKVCRYKQRA